MILRWFFYLLLTALICVQARAQNIEFVQEGLVTNANGQAMQGQFSVQVKLFNAVVGGLELFSETHPQVPFMNGYYAISIGTERQLDPEVFLNGAVYLAIKIDGRDWLEPRHKIVPVPLSFHALTAAEVKGSIHPSSISIGNQLVIDEDGKWVGDPAGLRGPAGGNGSPDTPEQVREKLIQVDGAGSGIDADKLDGLHATTFLRSDSDDTTTGTLAAKSFIANQNQRGNQVRAWMNAGMSAGANDQLVYFGLQNQNGNTNASIAFGDSPNTDLIFFQVDGNGNDNERMRLTADGFLGIGVVQPKVALEVNGGLLIGTSANCDANFQGVLRRQNGRLQLCDQNGWRQVLLDNSNLVGTIRGQDGSGSGIDADLLDGIDSADFVRTDNDVLTRLRRVDGSGSQVDADRLDGLDSSAFVQTGADILQRLAPNDGSGSGLDADRLDGKDSSAFLQTGAQVLDKLKTVDGSGSGLDADGLDGLDSAQFMRSDSNTGTTGTLSVGGKVTANALQIRGNGTVGIGVAAPEVTLDLAGEIQAQGLRLKPLDEAPADPVTGQIYFDSNEATMRFFDGEQWVNLGKAAPPSEEDDKVESYVNAVMGQVPAVYYQLNETNGNVANDSSGNNHHGTFKDNIRIGIDGVVGKAANPNGTGYVNTPLGQNDIWTSGTAGTVTAIVRLPDSFTNWGDRPFRSRHHIWSTFAYWQGTSVGTINGISGVHFWSFYNGSNEYIVSIPAIPGQWVHVAWVYRGNQFCGYVNGQESCVNAPQPIQRGSNRLFNIGRYHQDRTYPPTYPAEIQHVAAYPTSLTATKIREQYETMRGDLVSDGSTAEAALATCKELLDQNPELRGNDGYYWINPYSSNPGQAVRTFCDMSADGGGWTLAAYSARANAGATCGYEGKRNLYPMDAGGGQWLPERSNTAASLKAVPIATRSTEMLLARSDQDFFNGSIMDATSVNVLRIPNPGIVTLANPSNAAGADRGDCVAVTVRTLKGIDATGATRYWRNKSLGATWTDTYPTTYGAINSSACHNNTGGPAFATAFTGRNWARRYCWSGDGDAQGGAYFYWHRGWWDPTQHDRTGTAMIFFR